MAPSCALSTALCVDSGLARLGIVNATLSVDTGFAIRTARACMDRYRVPWMARLLTRGHCARFIAMNKRENKSHWGAREARAGMCTRVRTHTLGKGSHKLTQKGGHTKGSHKRSHKSHTKVTQNKQRGPATPKQKRFVQRVMPRLHLRARIAYWAGCSRRNVAAVSLLMTLIELTLFSRVTA